MATGAQSRLVRTADKFKAHGRVFRVETDRDHRRRTTTGCQRDWSAWITTTTAVTGSRIAKIAVACSRVYSVVLVDDNNKKWTEWTDKTKNEYARTPVVVAVKHDGEHE